MFLRISHIFHICKSTGNWKITLFNIRLNGANDAILLEVVKESLYNKLDETDLKLEHIWHALCH